MASSARAASSATSFLLGARLPGGGPPLGRDEAFLACEVRNPYSTTPAAVSARGQESSGMRVTSRGGPGSLGLPVALLVAAAACHVDRAYPLDRVREAFEDKESGGGKVRGKIAIVVIP